MICKKIAKQKKENKKKTPKNKTVKDFLNKTFNTHSVPSRTNKKFRVLQSVFMRRPIRSTFQCLQ